MVKIAQSHYMDKELAKEFKKKCIEEEIQYTDVIEMLVEMWVNNEVKIKK